MVRSTQYAQIQRLDQLVSAAPNLLGVRSRWNQDDLRLARYMGSQQPNRQHRPRTYEFDRDWLCVGALLVCTISSALDVPTVLLTLTQACQHSSIQSLHGLRILRSFFPAFRRKLLEAGLCLQGRCLRRALLCHQRHPDVLRDHVLDEAAS